MQIVWQELKKIWNLKWCLFLLLAGSICFYFGPLGQMNLKYLPLFESLDITLAQDLQQKYGNTLDAEEMEGVAELYRQQQEAFDQKIKGDFPELEKLGYEGYGDLESYCSSQDEFRLQGAELEKYLEIQENYYLPIQEKFEEEVVTREYYRMLLTCFANLTGVNLLEDSYEEGERDIEIEKETGVFGASVNRRMEEIYAREELSILPQCIESNLGFILQEYSVVLFLLAILFPLPYLAMDNRNRMNTMTAVTRKGRTLFRAQVCAMLLSVMVLLLCVNLIFYRIYCHMLPYESFGQCSIMGDSIIPYWYDFSLEEYLFLMLALISLLAVGLVGMTMFLSFYCRTIIGIVASVVPMYGIGMLLSVSYVRNAFHVPWHGGVPAGCMMAKYMSWLVVLWMLVIMLTVLCYAGRQRMRKDILE